MRRLVCYGDSNTWGYNPANGERFPENIRWTGVLSHILGREYTVLEEGLNGRTTVFDDPTEDHRNGIKTLMPCLLTHMPIDLVILMLGTNDTKAIFNANAFYITKGMARLVDVIQKSECGRNGYAPKALVVSPVEVGKNIMQSGLADYFHQYSVDVSRMLPGFYAQMAEEFGCHFLNAAQYASPSTADCIHLDEEGHLALARALADRINGIFL